MKVALLSIKPKYAEAILEGKKLFEFRKRPIGHDVDRVLIYVTKPYGKIVGSFRIGDVIIDTPQRLWELLNSISGLTAEEFFKYYEGYNKGVAIEIKDVIRFSEYIDPKKFIPGFRPPQSYIYIDLNFYELISKF